MAGGGDHPKVDVAELEGLVVADAGPFEGDLLTLREQVRGAVPLGEVVATGDVVVVDVRLRDRNDVDAGVGCGPLDRAEVVRRVDHDADATVVHEIAAVAQMRNLDRDDVHVTLP